MVFNPKKYDFSGKVAIVTGSSSGIGAAIALQFAQYGAKVTIQGRNVENLEKIAKQIKDASGLEPLQIIGDLQNDDLLPAKLIDETVAKFGRLDILINNAGTTTPTGNLASATLMEEFDQIFKVNVRAIVLLTQLAFPQLEKTRGNVVNISSVVSVKPWYLAYSASKAALDMVTKTSALELGPKGIRVNSINPGIVDTGFGRGMGLPQSTWDDFIARNTETSLLKRVGKPEDIANLASFLASDDAVNVTGSIYFSDSGALIKG